MALLKNGGSAVDAVELAIMFLEDAEITNAGYGSNLTLDGKVECDASIVDHDGRSGAVGAVSRKVSPSCPVLQLSGLSRLTYNWARHQKSDLLGACHSRHLGKPIVLAQSASELPRGIGRDGFCI